MEDKELLTGFLAGTLASFPHRDHVRTAYLLLGSYDFDEYCSPDVLRSDAARMSFLEPDLAPLR